MKISLNYKVFILVFLGILAAIFVSFLIYYQNIKHMAKEYAHKDLIHELEIIEKKINTIKIDVDSILNRTIQSESLLKSMGHISNHQDKYNYKTELFDNEKKLILNTFSTIIGTNSFWSMALFDLDGEVIAFKKQKNSKTVFGYSSFDKDGNIYITKKDGKVLKGAKPRKLDFSSVDKDNIFQRKKEFVFNKTIKVRYQNKHVGYLRVGYVLAKENYNQITLGTQNNSVLLTSKLIVGKTPEGLTYEFIKTHNENELFEINKNFVSYKKVLDPLGLYVVSYLQTNTLDKVMLKTIKSMFLILLITSIFLLILSYLFTSKFITKPLKELLYGIGQLKNKKVHTIKIDSKDELSLIAYEFNKISKELAHNFNELETTNILLNNILNTVHHSIFIKGVDGRYKMANKNFLNDCELEKEKDIIGKDDYDLWTKEDALFFRQKDSEVMRTLKPLYNYEQTQIRKDGTSKHLVVSKMPLLDSENNVIGVLGVYEDITQKKISEQKIKEKEKYLLQQSRLAQMGEMISMIAHQWRQPLSAISSTTNGLILKTAMGKFDREFFADRLKNITTYSQHLSSTIDDFRNFFKTHKEKRAVSLEDIVNDSLQITNVSLENKNIKIIKDFNCYNKILTYPNEIRQVVLNLVKNAEDILQEQENNNKWIKITTYKSDEKSILEVSDNAGGIGEDIIDKIFEPYFSTKTNKDGTGLGLYMSKTIIEEHCNGKLSVSNDEFGAVFRVEI